MKGWEHNARNLCKATPGLIPKVAKWIEEKELVTFIICRGVESALLLYFHLNACSVFPR